MIGRPVQQIRRFFLDRMVLRPTRNPIDPGEKRRVVFSAQTHRLECFVERVPNSDQSPNALVLKFPGTAGRAERSSTFPAEVLPVDQTSIWTWNPPGYGQSEGKATLGGIANTSIEFANFVFDQHDDPKIPAILCGNSLGCVTALHVAARMKIRRPLGLILRNPPPLIPVVKRVARNYPMGKLVGPITSSLCERMNATLSASQVDAPAVFLQSEFDTLVPVEMQQQVIDAYRGPTTDVLMEGLTHEGIPTELHQPAIERAIEWLWETMNNSSSIEN